MPSWSAEAAGLTQLKGHKSVGGMRASIYNAVPLAAVQDLVAYLKNSSAAMDEDLQRALRRCATASMRSTRRSSTCCRSALAPRRKWARPSTPPRPTARCGPSVRPKSSAACSSSIPALSERRRGFGLDEIISACRGLERGMTVAYLGPQGSFSEQAALSISDTRCRSCRARPSMKCSAPSEACQADVGMVPVENSTEGAVNRSLDLLLNTPLKILGERSLVIRHCLMSKSGGMDGIKAIAAHPQALAQCQGWLTRNYPTSSAWPLPAIRKRRAPAADPSVAAIAGEVAAAGLGIAGGGLRHPGRSAQPHALPGHRLYRAAGQRSGQDQPDPGRAEPRRRRLMLAPLA